ncbi:MAG: hypothetical protein K0R51_1174 [Cytophagaceae bacterium]|jgi:ribosomal protein L7/L12|nr:hypothetical protein [Cytophagaceae bacterium]
MNAYEYFQSYQNYFWQWEDQAEVISIPGSHTIAYRAFLSEVVQKLSHQGLPPFGSLVLAMIATNPGGLESIKNIRKLIDEEKDLHPSIVAETNNAEVFLKVLSEIPEEYKTGQKRALVFQAIFENCHSICGMKDSKSISESLSSGTAFGTFLTNGDQQTINRVTVKKNFSRLVFSKDFRTISLLAAKFISVEDILNKVAGLKDIEPESLQIEESLVDQEEKDFIEQLIDNNKTFHAAALVKRIWSGLHVPAHSFMPSMQSIGGVSDLTNKGTFDKLLISEFANDDLVFLSRVANNESLYIRRETPPESNTMERVILLDVSLKNWGTPKILSFSLSLAIAHHPKAKMNCRVYVIGDTYHAVSIDTVHAVIEGMQFVDAGLHAAHGLSAFFKDFPSTKGREVFLVTAASSLKQPAMLKAMNEYQDKIHYWLYTDASGTIDFYKKQQNSKKHLQRLQLPLQEIWEASKKKNRKVVPRESINENCPILIRSSGSGLKTVGSSDGEFFQVTKDKTLLRYYDKNSQNNSKGWEVIYKQLPFATEHVEVGYLSNGEYVLLMYSGYEKKLILLNLQTKKSVSIDHVVADRKPVFSFEQDNFYQFSSSVVYRIDLEGAVTKMEEGFSPPDRSEETYRANNISRLMPGILKNVHSVFIDDAGNLGFNKHTFHINKGRHIKLDTARSTRAIVIATKNSNNEFVFPDGSVVEVDRKGLFILKSSDVNIPAIYIPGFLDGALGVGTAQAFSGNEYYHKSKLYTITLQASGAGRLDLVKAIKSHTNYGLAKAKELSEQLPSVLATAVSLQKAIEMKTALEAAGAGVTLSTVAAWGHPDNEIPKIEPELFFERYITPFIKSIQGNGTAH